MNSVKGLKRDLEIVRRAIGVTPQQEYYRKIAEELTRIMGEYQRSVEREAAMLTEEGAEESRKKLSKDPETIEEGCQLGHIHNVLSCYARSKNNEVV